MRRLRSRTEPGMTFSATVLALGLAAVVTAGGQPPVAAPGCQVDYTVSSMWPGGFQAGITVKNVGPALKGWRLSWAFTEGQAVTQLWNGSYTQSGARVTVTNASYNATIAAGGTAGVGFDGTAGGRNPAPIAFSLNGTACAGLIPT